MKRLTVNLAPADLRKAGPSYDLPIAIGLLLATEQVYGDMDRVLFVGERGLGGALRHTGGCCRWSHRHGIETAYVPYEDGPEAGLEGAAGGAHNLLRLKTQYHRTIGPIAACGLAPLIQESAGSTGALFVCSPNCCFKFGFAHGIIGPHFTAHLRGFIVATRYAYGRCTKRN